LAEEYDYQSPYLYAHNNPIRYTDYLGLGADDQTDKDKKKKEKEKEKEKKKDEVKKKEETNKIDDKKNVEPSFQKRAKKAVKVAGAIVMGGLGPEDIPADVVALIIAGNFLFGSEANTDVDTDNIATPNIFLVNAALVSGLINYQFAQHGKNRGSLDSSELEKLKAKAVAGTLTANEAQKLKRHEKNTGERRSRQSKDEKK
jgi:hypothetical protein